jgi:flagellin
MSILISNSADAAHYLKQNQQQLQQSLKRLSSGKKITGGGEDPGGLAVAMKINASIKRLAAAESNVQNGISFLEVQDGLLETVGNIVTRISELKGLISDDPLKGTSEKASYQAEYEELVSQFESIRNMAFNGVDLFDNENATNTDEDLSIAIDDTGTTTIDITKSNLGHSELDEVFYDTSGTALNLELDTAAGVTVAEINTALSRVATLRAENGGALGRLQFTAQSLSIQKNNMMSALSRIEDIDLAEETANLAKYSIMTQASAAMVAQANSQNDIALMLLS